MFTLSRRILIVVAGALAVAACPSGANASPPRAVKGDSSFAADSVKVTLTCQAATPADTVFTVKCRFLVSEAGAQVATLDVPMGKTGSTTYAHAPLIGTPGSTVTLTFAAIGFGVNRSGGLSATGTPMPIPPLQVVIADGAPSAPQAVGGTVKYCPAGTSCP